MFKKYILPMLLVIPVFFTAIVFGFFWDSAVMCGLAAVLTVGAYVARRELPTPISLWWAYTPAVFFATASMNGAGTDMASYGLGLSIAILFEVLVGIVATDEADWIGFLIFFGIALTALCGHPFWEYDVCSAPVDLTAVVAGVLSISVLDIPQYVRWHKLNEENCQRHAQALIRWFGKDCEED